MAVIDDLTATAEALAKQIADLGVQLDAIRKAIADLEEANRLADQLAALL